MDLLIQKVKAIKSFAMSHKGVSLVAVLFLMGGGYYGYKSFFTNAGVVRYAFAQVQKGTLVISVSGSGQVSAVDQTDLKSKVSGDIVWLGTRPGEAVWEGQTIATLDDKDIQKQIRDAEQALKDEKNAYDQMTTDALRTLTTAYEDGYSTVSTSFFKLSLYVNDLKDVLGTENYGQEYIPSYQQLLGENSPFVDAVLTDQKIAQDFYNKNLALFRDISTDTNRETIYHLIDDTLTTIKNVSHALESARHMYDAIMVKTYKQYAVSSVVDRMKPKIESDVSSVYSYINSLQKIKDTIDDTVKNTPKNNETAKNNVEKRQDTLDNLKEELTHYTVRAPFTGVAAKVQAKNGDSVSPGTVLATFVTNNKVAEISLNEIDAAKVNVGQKATLTFDAVPGLTMTGHVTLVDTLGTVSQGVVTFMVKITFDTQDERVKTAMSVGAAIVIDAKTDVLMVPNSAVKSQNSALYVEVPSVADVSLAATAGTTGIALGSPLERKTVEVGASNDDFTEITSGLKEGDRVVSRTIQPTVVAATNQSSSFRIPGIGGGGGGRGGGGGGFTRSD